ncbi:MAG TPA: BrnT family toxin [Stellaceae bacterium]|nr:BrnT family toxin [Stellaceae bacterium]
MNERIAGFEWDEANREKCRKHGVSPAEIESTFHRPIAVFPDPAHSRSETRFKAIGKTDKGRSILIVFTLRRREGETVIRPISARYMHRKEVKYYEAEVAKSEKR